MRIRTLRYVISALASGALFSGCAGGGSSVTQSAATVPAAVQQGTLSGGHASVGRAARFGVRRTLDVPTCSVTGTGAFVGANNSNVAGGADSVVAGGSSNQACDVLSSIVGGSQNAVSGSGASDGFIGGGEENTVTGNDNASAIVAGVENEISSASSFIGGGSVNNVAGTLSVIAGGEDNFLVGTRSSIGGGSSNAIAVTGSYAAIGGGQSNNLSGEYGFLGAGLSNMLSAEYGVLVGGTHNTVSGEGAYIAAGGYNTASGEGAVIDGGFNSTAAGTFATVPGGYVNSAAGTYSFAAGARASAAQTGAFVWSDGSDGDTVLTSSRAYQFLARASGGFTLYTNAGSTVGAQLAAGSGSWASLSDRNAKTAIVPLDDDAVLAKVDALPISRWSYKSEHGVRHVGPMAQDFYAAFKVGEDDRHITSIDEDGVALAAIKALHADNRALRAREQTSDAMIAQLRRELAAERAHGRRIDAELAHIVAVLRK
jgi:hypothetical protein